ncbi:MAG TPA: ATP-binding protein [Methylomirabilota bacterium]|jgi:two-component system sensor histidine kinase HydH
MKPPFPLRYFLASVLLLASLATLFSLSTALRTQQELRRQLEEKGEALAEALDISSRNAILSNALMEEMIAQRLLDNARLVDQLLLSRSPDREWLQRISTANGLARIDLLDRGGHPYEPPPPRMMPGMMMARPPATAAEARERHAMMMYTWGRRWAPPSAEDEAPAAIRDRKFWEGTVLGVAVGARSFPGIIAVHADAHSVLDFSRTIGVQGQVEELGRQAGVESIALLDRDLTVLAHSDPARVGQRETDEELRTALEHRRVLARMAQRDASDTVYEVVKPVALEGVRTGLLRIGLSTAPMDRAWRRDRLAAVLMAVAVLGLGALGMATIFYIQNRHLTEIKTLEAEMARGERLATVGNLAAAVAHEIRNPLSAVSMGLQRLRAEFEPAEGEEYRRIVDLVQGEVRRLNAIVEEFLSLARPIQLRPEPVPVAALLDEVRRLVEPQAGRAGIVVEQTIPDSLPALRADRDRIKQVLLNLVLNAIDAMPSGGRLTMGGAASGTAVTLTVTDTGSGIPPELLPRVFEPYVTTKTKGLGLGLAIARRIVDAHGGRIEAESGAGQGTRFRVTLPRDGSADG